MWVSTTLLTIPGGNKSCARLGKVKNIVEVFVSNVVTAINRNLLFYFQTLSETKKFEEN